MAECTHDCSTCSQKCSKESLLEPQNQASNVKKVIGVVSGKGNRASGGNPKKRKELTLYE